MTAAEYAEKAVNEGTTIQYFVADGAPLDALTAVGRMPDILADLAAELITDCLQAGVTKKRIALALQMSPSALGRMLR